MIDNLLPDQSPPPQHSMLSNKNTAAEVEKMMRDRSATLNESVRRVMEMCPDEEFKAYRLLIGQIREPFMPT